MNPSERILLRADSTYLFAPAATAFLCLKARRVQSSWQSLPELYSDRVEPQAHQRSSFPGETDVLRDRCCEVLSEHEHLPLLS